MGEAEPVLARYWIGELAGDWVDVLPYWVQHGDCERYNDDDVSVLIV